MTTQRCQVGPGPKCQARTAPHTHPGVSQTHPLACLGPVRARPGRSVTVGPCGRAGAPDSALGCVSGFPAASAALSSPGRHLCSLFQFPEWKSTRAHSGSCPAGGPSPTLALRPVGPGGAAAQEPRSHDAVHFWLCAPGRSSPSVDVLYATSRKPLGTHQAWAQGAATSLSAQRGQDQAGRRPPVLHRSTCHQETTQPGRASGSPAAAMAQRGNDCCQTHRRLRGRRCRSPGLSFFDPR